MAKRKKKHQEERVLEPLVKPGEQIKAPVKVPANCERRIQTGLARDGYRMRRVSSANQRGATRLPILAGSRRSAGRSGSEEEAGKEVRR